MGSIRGRVFLWVLLTGLVVLGGAAAAAFEIAHREIDAVFDAQLVAASRTAAAQFRREYDAGDRDDDGEDDDEHGERDEDHHRYEQPQAVQIADGAGRLLFRAGGAPRRLLGDGAPGFSDDGPWRVYTTTFGENQVRVAQAHAVRARLAAAYAGRLLVPIVAGILLFAMAAWFAVRAGLRPLETTALAVSRRQAGDLGPLGITAPAEVQPLVREIDELFGRLGAAFERERRFTADAAHELRTPLAAIKAQAQAALGAADDVSRRHALTLAVAAADRAARLVEQLLVLARAEAGDRPAERGPVDLAALAAEVVAAHADAAVKKGIDLGLQADAGAVVVAGNRALLAAALRNLVDNAVRYSPAGGRVDVVVAPGGVTVDDAGPGIAAADREAALAPFRRGETSEPGSGLGLSIAARIAALHEGALTLSASPLGGLRAALRLGD